MKKILSIILCFTLVFSVCSFSLTANAKDFVNNYYYSFNDDSFYVYIYQNISKRQCMIFFIEIEGYYRNQKGIIDGGDGDLEYIIEEFLPTVYSSHQRSITVLLSFHMRPSSDNLLDDNGIAYIISKLNLTNLEACSIFADDRAHLNTDVKSMTPIVDALYSSCRNTLNAFLIQGATAISEVDDRIFTDFPKMETVDLDGVWNCWKYEEPVRITLGQYAVPYILVKVTPEIEESVYGEQYYGDEEGFLRDYYYDNIYPHFVAPENVTEDVVLGSANGGIIMVQYFYTCNGIRAEIGMATEITFVYEGDATRDGYVDSFDVATATEYVNTFEEPEDPAVMMAMDVVEDDYLDATDLAYITYIANFEE